MILAALFAVVTLVILPGVFLGYASLYRISRQEFFRACGKNLWRFVRLAILFAIVAGIAAGILHGIFHALAKLADESSYEKLPFYVHLIGFTLIFLALTKIRIWFDLAEADVVVSDQLAVRKSGVNRAVKFAPSASVCLARMWRYRLSHCSYWQSEPASGT